MTVLPRDRIRRALRRCCSSFGIFPIHPILKASSERPKRISSASPRALRAIVIALIPGIVALSACGYHVAGKAVLVPADVQTIAVPAFKNMSHQYRIEQTVTAAIKQELVERTKFRVTSNPAGADAVLHGLITNVRKNVLTFDPQTGRATTLQIRVTADVSLVDLHTHKPIYSNSNFAFREEYQISPLNQVLFEEDQAALDRLSNDLARTLVTNILEGF
jgi:outer membrane lipopolysaccharide assembly protein LptE/RlpB